ncbi:COG4315 family predicted lipoprotein [Streptomyces sp. NBC_00344]|uniref:COG4315 family predicted lipoprotein n=1 Tax=Streptomyces sp. NBC_00344 TaxID=2975720 RepID=UPI002E1D60EC
MVKTAKAGKLGTILVDAKGHTLYLFEADISTKSTCNGACAAALPPLLTSGNPTAGGSAESGLLCATKRSDGKIAGHPPRASALRYAEQSKPGDTIGQDLNQFGAAWLVLDGDGRKVGVS